MHLGPDQTRSGENMPVRPARIENSAGHDLDAVAVREPTRSAYATWIALIGCEAAPAGSV